MTSSPLKAAIYAAVPEMTKKQKDLARLKLYKLNNKDKISEQGKRYYQKNKERLNSRHREYARNGGNLKRYNLSLDEYQAMFERQQGLCLICLKPETSQFNGIIKKLSVDHDHATGVVRSLLCSGCNRGIGYFFDNSEIVLKAANYLKKHGR